MAESVTGLISDKIMKAEPNQTTICGHYRRFSSEQAWDWLLRGSPEGESEYIPGLLEREVNR